MKKRRYDLIFQFLISVILFTTGAILKKYILMILGFLMMIIVVKKINRGI